MANIIEGVVKYYDISEKSYKGGAKIHKVTLTVGGNDVRASAFIKSETPLSNAKKGDTVKTVVEENDKGYMDFDPKKFKVTERDNSQVSGGSSASSGKSDNAGMTRGNAIHAASRIVLALAGAGVYESSDEAAIDLVRIAETYIMPYGMEGKVISEVQGESKTVSEPVPNIPEEPNQEEVAPDGWDDDVDY